ncbi:MAG TPA: UDP-glucose 4-epimerase GalE [Vicinamibacterales bacterium]
MRVLVVGGAGYIGSVTVAHLLECGHQVVVLDNLSRGHRDAVPDDVPFIEADLADTSTVSQAMSDRGIESVVHLAAFALVGESVANPGLYYRNNVTGGLSLLDAMTSSGVRNLVFSSTCAVYGEPARVPLVETDPLEPTNPYGETKLAFERALWTYHRAYGLKFVSLRYFNAAGATARHQERHDPETHLIPIVLQAAAGTRPHVTIFGTDYPTPDGTCIRDYIHVSDLAHAHALALDGLGSGQRTADVYNLGCGGKGYSVRQVVDAAQVVTGRTVPVREGPRREGDPAVLVASSAKAQRELGWVPHHRDLVGIIESAWKYGRKFLETRGTFAS